MTGFLEVDQMQTMIDSVNDMKRLVKLNKLVNHSVLFILDGIVVDGTLDEVFHLYGDESEPLSILIRGAGHTNIIWPVDKIQAVEENEIHANV